MAKFIYIFFTGAGVSTSKLSNASAFLAIEQAQLGEVSLPDGKLVVIENTSPSEISSTQTCWVFEFCKK